MGPFAQQVKELVLQGAGAQPAGEQQPLWEDGEGKGSRQSGCCRRSPWCCRPAAELECTLGHSPPDPRGFRGRKQLC